jgi:hypothetical protein
MPVFTILLYLSQGFDHLEDDPPALNPPRTAELELVHASLSAPSTSVVSDAPTPDKKNTEGVLLVKHVCIYISKSR